MSHLSKGTKDFFLGALIGSIIGATAVSTSSGKRKAASMRKIRETIDHVSKAIQTSKNGKHLTEILDWATEGIELWKKIKKGE